MYHGHWWGLITMSFVHKEILHLLFNLYWMWVFGKAFEGRFGSVALLLFVVVAAFVSSGFSLATEGPGIGLSGVGYALFGFAWIGRSRFPEFARVVNQRVVQTFLLWFIFCVYATYSHMMNIANVAHLAGLLFGMGFAAMLVKPQLRIPLGLALFLFTAVSAVPVFYNPLSLTWLGDQAVAASKSHDYPRAITFYQKVIARSSRPEWAWHNLALIYGEQGDAAKYRHALEELRLTNPASAAKIEQAFGPDK